jgi:hypothetical protein
MKVLTCSLRKIADYEELGRLSAGIKAKWYDIHEVITISKSEYNYFINNLLEDYSFLENQQNYLFLVTDGENRIFVDTQGYNYARYTGIIYDWR